MIVDFEEAQVPTTDGWVFIRRSGRGPALLLLHGFPETHLMWRDIAPELTGRFTVICADLPGYGRSSCPPRRPQEVAAILSKFLGAPVGD